MTKVRQNYSSDRCKTQFFVKTDVKKVCDNGKGPRVGGGCVCTWVELKKSWHQTGSFPRRIRQERRIQIGH
jgi:hypothetical protein